eukprot:TRINITY_DN9615_c0_g1_i1.p1 TRINITY_DN9615_c0_g1~~TRINITY_DN9615_c0_g1_i1.p1  ORF type:complete len:111 (-),score=31.98 TRINITY_DN9615_c0_g1_i1:76-408(-)
MRTLIRFLMRMAMKSEYVSIELKNGTVVRGKLVGVDFGMSCHLKNVKMTARDKPTIKIENMMVRGSTIRYVIFDDMLNLDTILNEVALRDLKKKETTLPEPKKEKKSVAY